MVHEINKEAKIVWLDDLSIPVETEVKHIPVQYQDTLTDQEPSHSNNFLMSKKKITPLITDFAQRNVILT